MPNERLTAQSVWAQKVVVVGAAHFDRIAASDSVFRSGCSNPGRVTERFGGAAYNAAVALRTMGVQAHLVSASGGDETAELVGIALKKARIGDGRITWLDRRSASYTALLDASGELIGGIADMEIYDRLVPRTLRRRHLLERLKDADGILVDANLPDSTLVHLAEYGPPLPLAAIAVSPAKAERLRGVLPRLAMLFASRAEVMALLGLSPGAGDAEVIRASTDHGLAGLIVTDGPRAVLAVNQRGAWRQATPPVETISDVVGAGDTVAGAAFAAFLQGQPFLDAVRIGLAAASLRIAAGFDTDSAAAVNAIADALPAPEPISA